MPPRTAGDNQGKQSAYKRFAKTIAAMKKRMAAMRQRQIKMKAKIGKRGPRGPKRRRRPSRPGQPYRPKKRPKWAGKGPDPRGAHPARPRGPRPKWSGKGRDPRDAHPYRPKPKAKQTDPGAHLKKRKRNY